MMAHGVSAAVAFRLRGERDRERIRALLELSSASSGAMYGGLGLLLVTGVIAGFMGNWWGQGWIWASLGLLVALIPTMYLLGTLYFGKIRKAIGLPYAEGMKYDNPPVAPVSPAELEALLSSLSSRPIVVAVTGVGGIVIIIWLMMFKPF